MFCIVYVLCICFVIVKLIKYQSIKNLPLGTFFTITLPQPIIIKLNKFLNPFL